MVIPLSEEREEMLMADVAQMEDLNRGGYMITCEYIFTSSSFIPLKFSLLDYLTHILLVCEKSSQCPEDHANCKKAENEVGVCTK